MGQNHLMTTNNHIQIEAIALNAEGDAAPEWVQLLPAGPKVSGRDGRAWQMLNPDAVVDAFNKHGGDLPVDFEHATQVKGDLGEPAPAVGWITEVEVRNREIWGKVNWLKDGAEAVASRAYRYISPVFGFAKTSGAITRLKSAGLTNQPNLQMTALNKEDDIEEPKMNKAITDALGLQEGASNDVILTAINKLVSDEATARNKAENPSLDDFVPRADHDVALNKVAEFETAEATRKDEAITQAIDTAIEAGKITPASRDFYTASCKAEGGLEAFNSFIEAAPKIAPNAELDDPTAQNKTKLTPEETAVCKALGQTEEEFLKAKDDAQ